MRLLRVSAPWLAAAGALAGCGGGSHCRAQPRVPPVVERASVHVAKLLHEPNPSSGKYVRTTQGQAASLVGGSMDKPNRQVYLVVLSGHFARKGFLSGTLADFTVDARSGKLVDIGTSSLLPAISPLGRVRYFRLRDCASR